VRDPVYDPALPPGVELRQGQALLKAPGDPEPRKQQTWIFWHPDDASVFGYVFLGNTGQPLETKKVPHVAANATRSARRSARARCGPTRRRRSTSTTTARAFGHGTTRRGSARRPRQAPPGAPRRTDRRRTGSVTRRPPTFPRRRGALSPSHSPCCRRPAPTLRSKRTFALRKTDWFSAGRSTWSICRRTVPTSSTTKPLRIFRGR